jgi:queuosine biosynthesis protein QueC
MKNSSALVTFSGGQDSTTCLGWAKQQFNYVEAISFNYGQQHSIELEQGAKICKDLGIKRTVVDISFLKDICDSALTSVGGDVTVKHSRLKTLPASFVPNRNLILLSLANTYAQKAGLENLVTGTCQTDDAGYPDCRRLFIDELESSLFAATNISRLSLNEIRAILVDNTCTIHNEDFILIRHPAIEEIKNFFGGVGEIVRDSWVKTDRSAYKIQGDDRKIPYYILQGTSYEPKLLSNVYEGNFLRRIFANLSNELPTLFLEGFIKIHTPLMYLTKAQTFYLAEKVGILNTVLEDSHTCYIGNREFRHPWGYGCGECPSCKLRKKGYEDYITIKNTF